jgi:hypothetical protein
LVGMGVSKVWSVHVVHPNLFFHLFLLVQLFE